MKLRGAGGCIVIVLIFALLSVAEAVVPPFPTITGPVPDPDPVLGPMFPGIRPSLTPGHDLADFNYVTEEYWISGTACSAAYKTRILIRRPSDPSKFSGVVVAEPLHRGGNALIFNFTRFGLMQRGHIGLEIDARSINLNNANNALQSLQPFNPTRYGPVGNTNVANGFVLANNNNAQANEVMAQVGRLIKTLTEPTNPLKDWPIQKIVMGGTSDSSDAVRLYLANGTGTGCTGSVGHTTFRMPDNGPIYDGFFRGSILNTTPTPILTDVPHIEMPTQFELHSSSGFRKADSDDPANRYRLYEMSGSSHNDTRDNAGFDPSFPGGQTCDGPLSRFDFNAAYFNSLQHLINWTFGVTPPIADRMDFHSNLASCTFEGHTLSTRVGMDPTSFCDAKAGVRSTYLDVPLFTYKIPNTGPGSLCNQTSQQFRFSDSTAIALYGNARNFGNKWKRRLGELINQRWVPLEYADEIRSDAKLFWDNGPESLFWRHTTGANTVWYLDGATQVSTNALPSLDSTSIIAGTGDFDGDGQIDLLVRKSDGTNTLWLINAGTITTVANLPALDSSWNVAAIGDFDGDGKSDVLWRRNADGANLVWLLNGATVTSIVTLPSLDKNWSVGAAADFDGDGKADILFKNRNGTNIIWLLNGAAVSTVNLAPLDKGSSIAAVADFDGDGKADLLLRNTDGSNAVWLINGATITSKSNLPSLDSSWSVAVTADYDRDGKVDIVWRKNGDGTNVIWFMNGTTVANTASIVSLAPGWQAVNK
jgi:hypothetical protein